MTDQEIMLAIAEECGTLPKRGQITEIQFCRRRGGYVPVRVEWEDAGNKVHTFSHLPDYLGDLSAMQKALKALGDRRWEFGRILMNLVHPQPVMAASAIWVYCCEATARQWAEAFVRTIGKWREEL